MAWQKLHKEGLIIPQILNLYQVQTFGNRKKSHNCQVKCLVPIQPISLEEKFNSLALSPATCFPKKPEAKTLKTISPYVPLKTSSNHFGQKEKMSRAIEEKSYGQLKIIFHLTIVSLLFKDYSIYHFLIF